MEPFINSPFEKKIHFLLMFAGTLLFLIGGFIARFMRKKRWWLKAHRVLNLTGLGLMLGGFGFMFYYFQNWDLGHFSSPHSVAGGLGLILFIVTPVIVQVAIKAKKPALRVAHRWLGRFSLILAVSVASMGLLKVLGNI